MVKITKKIVNVRTLQCVSPRWYMKFSSSVFHDDEESQIPLNKTMKCGFFLIFQNFAKFLSSSKVIAQKKDTGESQTNLHVIKIQNVMQLHV